MTCSQKTILLQTLCNTLTWTCTDQKNTCQVINCQMAATETIELPVAIWNIIYKRGSHTKFPMKAGFLTGVSVISAKVTWARHLALAFINIYPAGRLMDLAFLSRSKTCSVSIWGRCKSPTILKISRQSNIETVLHPRRWSPNYKS